MTVNTAKTAAATPKSVIHVSPSSSQRHALRRDGTRSILTGRESR